MGPFGDPGPNFLNVFWLPERFPKNDDFSSSPKSSKNAESIGPCTPKVGFWIKSDNFWHPFLHRCFNVFRKWQKCEISEEYNAKRGSEPSKTFDFGIDFSYKFFVFSNPPPRGRFSTVKVPGYTQKGDFGAIRDFPGRRKRFLGAAFLSKNADSKYR